MMVWTAPYGIDCARMRVPALRRVRDTKILRTGPAAPAPWRWTANPATTVAYRTASAANRPYRTVRARVARRPPWNHVGDVGAGAVQPDRSNHPVEQLAGTSDERQPFEVFLAS